MQKLLSIPLILLLALTSFSHASDAHNQSIYWEDEIEQPSLIAKYIRSIIPGIAIGAPIGYILKKSLHNGRVDIYNPFVLLLILNAYFTSSTLCDCIIQDFKVRRWATHEGLMRLTSIATALIFFFRPDRRVLSNYQSWLPRDYKRFWSQLWPRTQSRPTAFAGQGTRLGSS